jgi:hypothetical protein
MKCLDKIMWKSCTPHLKLECMQNHNQSRLSNDTFLYRFWQNSTKHNRQSQTAERLSVWTISNSTNARPQPAKLAQRHLISGYVYHLYSTKV